LLSWPHSGFSSHAEKIFEPDDTEHLERLARYIARAPLPIDAVHATDEGEVRLVTPPHPRTREQERLPLCRPPRLADHRRRTRR
jgi:hypothetical protein